MIAVSDNEFTKYFDRYLDDVQYGPLAVTSDERVIGYFISPDEFEEYVRLRARLPRAFSVDEL